MNIDLSIYHTILSAMAFMGLFVFITLYFVDAGYGKFRSKKWGYSVVMANSVARNGDIASATS